MTPTATGPILLVCADADRSFAILDRLYDEGFSTVGPAPTAGLALTLTAQTMARTAILAGQTIGRRNVAELAEELTRTWSVECFILDEEAAANAGDDNPRSPMEPLRRALGGHVIRPVAAT